MKDIRIISWNTVDEYQRVTDLEVTSYSVEVPKGALKASFKDDKGVKHTYTGVFVIHVKDR